jgi:hypothetical protein
MRAVRQMYEIFDNDDRAFVEFSDRTNKIMNEPDDD